MNNIPCFLIPAIVGLISAILGYLLGKMLSSKTNIDLDANVNYRNSFSADANGSLKADLDACNENTTKLNAKISALQTELDSHKAKAASSQSFVSASSEKKSTESKAIAKKITAKTSLEKKSNKPSTTKKSDGSTKSNAISTSGFDANSASAAYGKKVKLDDLKIVEGIGPKIEGLYNAAGINTWKALSETSFDRSRQILDAAGERYAIHNPTTWPKQSLLAHEGKFAELKALQDSLNGGKE